MAVPRYEPGLWLRFHPAFELTNALILLHADQSYDLHRRHHLGHIS